ncbi:MAG: T9SS C-terminal target domain-containing protein, partial [Chitinophagia bacterium]|nr:T9SS C-terminal target domain-containing protein [Chitinophagia bacterium]
MVCCRGQELRVSKTRFISGDTLTYVDPRHTIATRDGGYLFTGITNSQNGGGDIPAWYPATAENVVVGKLDSNLNISWIKLYGGTGYDIGMNAVQTCDGGYAILAFTLSNDYDVTSVVGNGDTWLIRLDSGGNLLWQKCYGSTYDDGPIAIAETRDGGLIFSNISNGSGVDVPAHYSGSQFDYDWFIVKTDSSGNKQWSKTIGGRGDEYESGTILCDTDGYLFISSSNSTDFDVHDTIWHPGITSGYDFDVFKLDFAGNIVWDSSYGSSNGDIVYDAKWDPRDSTIVMVGVTLANDYMVSGNHGGEDMWVIKIDRQGRLLWQRCLGSAHDETATSLYYTQFGYVILGNTFVGPIGNQDLWLFALDNRGNEITDKIFGGISIDYARTILFDKKGCLAIGSSSSGNFSDGVGIGHRPGRNESFFTRFAFWPLSVDSPILDTYENLTVHPNPSNGLVYISFPLILQGYSMLQIYNCLGEIVYTRFVSGERSAELQNDKWPSGVYLVQWKGEKT